MRRVVTEEFTPAHDIPDTTNYDLSRNRFPFNQTGLPAITVPAGLTSGGTPIGFPLAAGAFEDVKLLEIAEVVERLIGFDNTPSVLKATALV